MRLSNPLLEKAGSIAVAPPVERTPGPWLQLLSPAGFEWNRLRLPFPDLSPALDGLRILHLSDFHVRGRWQSAYDELIAGVQKSKPDLILFTGDFIENKRRHEPALPHLRRLLAGLNAPLGFFGIFGNHDIALPPEAIRGTNVTLIEGARRIVTRDGGELELIGLPSLHGRRLTDQVLDSFPPKTVGVPRVVMGHYPYYLRRAARLQPDLLLAGHTHGGQVCLPGGFALLRHDPLPRRLCKGVHRVGSTWMMVSRGFGFTGPPIRLFCPAEVIEIALTRGPALGEAE